MSILFAKSVVSFQDLELFAYFLTLKFLVFWLWDNLCHYVEIHRKDWLETKHKCQLKSDNRSNDQIWHIVNEQFHRNLKLKIIRKASTAWIRSCYLVECLHCIVCEFDSNEIHISFRLLLQRGHKRRNVIFCYFASMCKCFFKHIDGLDLRLLSLKCVVHICEVVISCFRMLFVNWNQLIEFNISQIQLIIQNEIE